MKLRLISRWPGLVFGASILISVNCAFAESDRLPRLTGHDSRLLSELVRAFARHTNDRSLAQGQRGASTNKSLADVLPFSLRMFRIRSNLDHPLGQLEAAERLNDGTIGKWQAVLDANELSRGMALQ